VRFLTKPLAPEELIAALDDVLHGPPEPAQRKEAQHRGLASLARIERDAAGGAAPVGPRTRLSRLELPRPPTSSLTVLTADETLVLNGDLTARQRELLRALLAAPSVSAAATDLGMSRSNVYASLRRVGRKLGVTDVSELLRLLRAGRVTGLREP
jgi:DNA-binding NarL/FixJ family response regulator